MKLMHLLSVKWAQGKIKTERDLDREICKALDLPYIPESEVVGW